ncbi:putative ribonuclease H-like domain-containing protein [Tanacetum coccineum]
MYSVDMKNIVPKESLTCLVAKATLDESMLWHRRLGHVNFKTINKLVKENLVRGLPSKRFKNDQTCVACLKGKQHKASFVTDDYTRFTCVFFLATKDETSGILKSFINEIQNLVDKKVKIIRCDNETEFKNKVMSKFCEHKGIKREFSIARTPQQNGKFDGKSDDRLFVGCSLNSKAFRVYNIRTRKVEESLHIRFLEDKPIIAGDGPKWLFDIDVLTKSMNYVPVVAGTNSNDFIDGLLFDSSLKNARNDEPQPSSDAGKKDDEDPRNKSKNPPEGKIDNAIDEEIIYRCVDDSKMPELEDDSIVGYNNPMFNEDVDAEADMNNLDTFISVSPIPITRIHNDHPLEQIIRDLHSAPQTKRMTKTTNEQGFISAVYEGKTHKDLYTCLFACLLSQVEPKKLIQALTDPSWIEAIQDELLYLCLMDVKSAFLYGKIEEEVYVCQPLRFNDLEFPDRVKGDILLVQVYVDDIIFGSTKKELCTEFEKLMHKKFQMSSIDKYVDEILKKFGFSTVRIASTPMETSKPLLKDTKAEDVDVYLYRSMIGSLMYLTASRPDIMFVVCTCARFQVTPKVSHLHAVKRIFRYLKGQPKLGLWYPKDSPFNLEAYTDSDYAGASLYRKSTTGASCCGQVLWIQNQLLDCGYNFMNTKIFIDNESTICIVKNLVLHSKTKHIEIRHHFIKDSNEKKLIQMVKIHTDQNVVDLLTKAFDVGRFQYLIASIGMLNLLSIDSGEVNCVSMQRIMHK